jgi:hypothetical protein
MYAQRNTSGVFALLLRFRISIPECELDFKQSPNKCKYSCEFFTLYTHCKFSPYLSDRCELHRNRLCICCQDKITLLA